MIRTWRSWQTGMRSSFIAVSARVARWGDAAWESVGCRLASAQGLRHVRHVFPPTTDRPALPSKPREAAHLPHRWLLKRGSTSQTSLALRPNSAAAASPMHHGRFDDANRNILLRTRYTKLNRTCHAGVVPQPGKMRMRKTPVLACQVRVRVLDRPLTLTEP